MRTFDIISSGQPGRIVLSRLIVVLTVFLVGDVRAQTTCAPGTAEAYLDVGNVRAKILNNGGLFWNGGANGYEVPKGEGVHAIFAANLLLGGRVDDELRMAATLYRPFQYWTGPVDSCDGFDRIWQVEYDDLAGGADAEGRLMEWPVDAGAPFIDVDGNGAYNPAAGDRPELIGDQQLWWVMNDAGIGYGGLASARMGVEVRATAFAFKAPGVVGTSTFYRYRFRNTSSIPVEDVYAGLFVDADLGSFSDDFVGSDSTLGMGYVYNADNDDDGAYEDAPPAIGFTVLKRPQSSMNDSAECSYPDNKPVGFTNVMHFIGGAGVTGEPGTFQDFHYYMQSRWKDGQPVTMGEQGRHFSQEPTRYFFPGDPVAAAFWSERNRDNNGEESIPHDRSLITSLGPFCLVPGEEVELVIAIVWSRGSSNLDSVRQLREDVAYIQSIRDVILTPRVLPGRDPDEQESGPDLPFAASVYPNPVGGTGGSGGGNATVRFSTPEPINVSVTVFNTLGQRVFVAAEPGLVDAGDHSWTLPTARWTPGVYLVRITAGHAVTTRRLVVTSST